MPRELRAQAAAWAATVTDLIAQVAAVQEVAAAACCAAVPTSEGIDAVTT